MKKLVSLCLIFLCLPILPQDNQERYSFGLSINPQLATSFPQNEVYGDLKPILGGAMGLNVSLNFNDNHSIESGVFISRKGYTVGGKYDLHDTLKEAYLDHQGSYPTRTNVNHYYYFLDLPLQYRGNVLRTEFFSLYVKGGFLFNFLYGFSIQKVEVYNNGTKNKESSFMRPEDIWVGDPRKFNVSGSFALGINVPLSGTRSLSIEPNFNVTLYQGDTHFGIYFFNAGVNISLWLL
jgi:hypothetical protein